MALIYRVALLALCAFFGSVAAYSSEPNEQQLAKYDIDKLYSDNANTRSDAARRLAATGPSAVPLLVRVVCDRAKSHFDVAWPVAAKILGDLKAEAAAPCLVDLLMYEYPSIGPVNGKSDETLAAADPAFAALMRIGDPAVHAIKRRLPFLGPDPAIMAMRVLRAINTPSARQALEAYIKVLQDQVRVASQILRGFDEKSGG
ncbi:MAG TPA: hypothetical protein VD837_02385 [Terriglobales bacterium]|nr:hypothetical protein [Terriglobales bacterium]